MKKNSIVLILAALITTGLISANAFAWNCGGPGAGYGARGWNGSAQSNVGNQEDIRKFLDETAQIRKSIVTDRAELNALMAGQNPDPEKARELAAKIADNEEALNKIAGSANVNGFVGCSYGQSGSCGGPGSRGFSGYGNCSGPGGRGYGRF